MNEKIIEALLGVEAGYRSNADFTRRGMSPSRNNRAIKEGYIIKTNAFGIIEYSLSEKGINALKEYKGCLL